MAAAENPVPSASKLWAVPSKEWVIPAKPKPGRKPKKDQSGPINEETEGDTASRKNNNRAAQRAFRERKQSQLAELQARIQVYEHGEVERSVALQNLAKKYKEENERLREENAALQQKVAQLEAEKLIAIPALYQPRKRAVSVDDPVQPTKRIKIVAASLSASISTPIYYPSSPSSTSSIGSYPSPTFEAHPASHRVALPGSSPFPEYPTENNGFLSTSTADDTDSPFQRFDCGFCDEHTPCVCREILQQHVADRIGRPNQPTLKIDHVEASGIASSSTSQAQYSILNNLPAYQPAVPLRRKALNKQTNSRSSIFPIVRQPSLPPTCSGDPRNCRACASDDFGQAFCDAVNSSMAASEAADTTDKSEDIPQKSSVQPESETRGMVPCDDAWRQLKSHPNVEFSDLKLLADVVARRSKCTGSRVVISPPLGSVTPERMATPVFLSNESSRLPEFSREILNTRDGTAVGEHHRVGVREVPREALRAALDLLDAKTRMSLS